MVHLDYRDSRAIYTQIADNFRSQIRAGVLSLGDKLPSVRELASELAINPNTIQKAFAELDREEKNGISHRVAAVRAFAKLFAARLIRTRLLLCLFLHSSQQYFLSFLP